MTYFTAEEMSKLPKWAQAKVQEVERNREAWQVRAQAGEGLIAGVAEVFVWEHSMDNDRPIGGPGTHVYFCYGRPGSLDRFAVNMDEQGRLHVRTSQAVINIQPQVSNGIIVEAVERT